MASQPRKTLSRDLDANERVSHGSQVWPRFAIWVLNDVANQASPEGKEMIGTVIQLYQRELEGEVVAEREWLAACITTHNKGPLAKSAWQAARAAMMLFKRDLAFPGFRRMQTGALVFISADYAADSVRTAIEHVDHPDFAGMRHACRLLLELYLHQTPRDATEGGLQRAVLADEKTLPIYCDYLEERGDEAAGWLQTWSTW